MIVSPALRDWWSRAGRKYVGFYYVTVLAALLSLLIIRWPHYESAFDSLLWFLTGSYATYAGVNVANKHVTLGKQVKPKPGAAKPPLDLEP